MCSTTKLILPSSAAVTKSAALWDSDATLTPAPPKPLPEPPTTNNTNGLTPSATTSAATKSELLWTSLAAGTLFKTPNAKAKSACPTVVI